MTVLEKIDLTDRTWLATLPRPTGGELVVDEELHAIFGVALIGPESRNDGAIFSPAAHADFERLINESQNPITVQFGHFSQATFQENGVIPFAYQDGRVLRGAHFLNPHKDSTAELLWNAQHARGNQCYSVEAWENDLAYKDTAKGRSIVAATGIKWFAVDRSCGTTDGMNQSLVREERNKMSTTKKAPTPADIKSRYPDVYKKIVADVRAETLATVEDEAVTQSQIVELESQVATLEEQLSAANAKCESLEAEARVAARTAEITEEWSKLMEGVDLSLLPDTDEGKAIAELAELSEEETKSLAEKEAEAAAKDLTIRASQIKASLSIAESFRRQQGSFVDVAPKKQPVTSRPALSAIDLGGGVTLGGAK